MTYWLSVGSSLAADSVGSSNTLRDGLDRGLQRIRRLWACEQAHFWVTRASGAKSNGAGGVVPPLCRSLLRLRLCSNGTLLACTFCSNDYFSISKNTYTRSLDYCTRFLFIFVSFYQFLHILHTFCIPMLFTILYFAFVNKPYAKYFPWWCHRSVKSWILNIDVNCGFRTHWALLVLLFKKRVVTSMSRWSSL